MPLFLDDVKEPQNFNPVLAPFDLLVSDLFLKLEGTNSDNKAPFSTVTEKKNHIVQLFVQTWRTHFGSNIYPAVRLIFPNRDGRKYHIKDVALTRLVSRLLNLAKGLTDYTIIQNWKKLYQLKLRLAGTGERHQLGDLPLLVSRIILRRRDQSAPVKSSVTVDEVNEILDRLTEKTLAREQADLLSPFIDKLTIPEVRFFFQMILKESMLSFFERSFFVAWHPDAYDLYKVCNDMRRIFWILVDPEVRLLPQQLCVQPMYQFVPQSSKKLEISYDNLCRKMTVPMLREGKDRKLLSAYDELEVEGHFLIEEKIDGDRMLMHMVEGKYLWHTRRRRDYTLVYGENVHVGSLTKHLAQAFHPSVKTIVLDGEMVAWSKDREMLLPFGTLRSAAVQEALKEFNLVDVYEGNNSWPLYIIFDILHLNGQDLSQLPLFYRKQLLSNVVREVPHRFEILLWVKASTPQDLKANMQRIVCEHNEGIMVKSLLLKYRVHSRDSTWIKVKPEYLESFGENLDLVVVGKIGRVKTSYICGLRDDENEGVYKLFCAVANGFLRPVYAQIESKLCNFWVDFRARPPPLDLLQFGHKKPDFWINPANLIVLEIKARSMEVTADTPYAAGSTLHNLWCRSVREDKAYDECLSLQEYHDLRRRYTSDINKSQAVNRNRKRDFTNSIVERYAARRAAPQLALFAAMTFLVVTDLAQGPTGDEIRRQISAHGGTVWTSVQRHSAAAFQLLVVGEIATPRLQARIAEGYDVVRPRWVFRSIQENRLLPLEPQFVYHAGRRLRRAMMLRVDEFGDSFAQDPAENSIGAVMKLVMTKQLTASGTRSARAHLKLENQPMHWRLFRGCTFYIEADEIGPRIERYGGTLVPSPVACSYIVVLERITPERLNALSQQLAASYDEHTRLPYIVGPGFVAASVAAGTIADPGLHTVLEAVRLRR